MARTLANPLKKGAFEPGKEEKIETFEPVKCRFIKLKAISEINGLPWTSAAEIRVIQSGEDASVMTYQINRATSLLAEFERTKSFDQLKGAYMAEATLPEPGVDKTVPKAVARQERAKVMFSLLAVMGQNINTNIYGPNDRIAVDLVPPLPTNGGPAYASGVDPPVIKDPEVRAKYEAAIQENEKKKARALFQTRLRNLDQIANIETERFLRHYYTTSKEDQSELENLMKQAKLSPARAQKLKALFESRKPSGNDVDTNLTKQISNILTECKKIAPGTTRAELLRVFAAEGGISTATHQTYVHRRCPYIKVDVDFILSDPEQKVIEDRPTDTIGKISRPYLGWGIND